MRLTSFAFFLCAGITATCQSAAPAPTMPDKSLENTQSNPSWTNCKGLAPDLSNLSFAPRVGDCRPSTPATWHWNRAQVDSKAPFHSSLLNSEVRSRTLVAQNVQPGFCQMYLRQWPNAKGEPIPTRWPKAKFEPIPSEWPNLKMVPITAQHSAPAALRVPVK